MRRYALALVIVAGCHDAPRKPSTAYRDGGIPDRDPAIEAVLHGDLATLHPFPAKYGKALVDAWAAVYATTDLGERFRRVHEVDDALVAAGLAYRVDLEYAPRGWGLGVEAFDVDRVVIVDIDGTKYPVTEVHEIKRAKVRPLGLANGGPAKVFGDRIAENVLLELRELGSKAPRTTSKGTSDAAKAFRIALAPRIHDAWRGLVGADADAAMKISALLDERHDDTAQLFVPLDHASARVVEIDRELHRLDAPRILARMTAAFVASAERHEARHMADEKVMPREVKVDEGMMQRTVDFGMSFEHPNISDADAAWREVSAYLEQLATTDDGTYYALWWYIAASIFEDPAPPDAWCAMFIVGRMQQALGGDIDRFASDGVIDIPRFATAAIALGQRSPDELRRAAATVRKAYFP